LRAERGRETGRSTEVIGALILIESTRQELEQALRELEGHEAE
jgi:hypothetical protein